MNQLRAIIGAILALVILASPALAAYPGSILSASKGGTGVSTGLSQLSASNLTSGTVPDARLSANVPLLSGSNAFSRTAQAGTAETMSTWGVTDSTSKVTFANQSASDGVFASLITYQGDATVTPLYQSMSCGSDSGSNPAWVLNVALTGGGALSNRTIGSLRNNNVEKVLFGNDGAITTQGNITTAVAGKGLRIKEGSNARMGTATLAGGTATVSNTSVTASTRIYLTRAAGAGTRGLLEVGTVTASTSFVINSVDSAGALVADTSTANWLLVEPSP